MLGGVHGNGRSRTGYGDERETPADSLDGGGKMLAYSQVRLQVTDDNSDLE